MVVTVWSVYGYDHSDAVTDPMSSPTIALLTPTPTGLRHGGPITDDRVRGVSVGSLASVSYRLRVGAPTRPATST